MAGAEPNSEMTAAAVVVALEPVPVVTAGNTLMPCPTLPPTTTADPPCSTWPGPSASRTAVCVGALVER